MPYDDGVSPPSDDSGDESGKPDVPGSGNSENGVRSRTGGGDVPSTRKQAAQRRDGEDAAEPDGGSSKMQAGNDEPLVPPTRASQLDMLHGKTKYPDDGPFSAKLRKIDGYIGVGEQGLLVFFMATLVVATATLALADKIGDYRTHLKDDLIRSCTFGLAMFGGAFASHQAKHLAMDLISRRLAPRARLFLRVFLGLFTIVMVVLLIRSGMQIVDSETARDKGEKLISDARLAWFIPAGGALMLVHTIIHLIIDVDYIGRHKLPPERMRSH